MDQRQFSPSAARNRAPILDVLHRVLPGSGRVLEIASGTGEHVVFFAGALTGLTWFPSDPDEEARASISAWIASERAHNVNPPVAVDVRSARWGVEAHAPFDAIVAINMIHISPWPATLGLMAGAARLLAPRGLLITYGPYRRNGAHTAPSNEAFDLSLQARNPEWGVRDVADVERAANAQGLSMREVVEMPANNLSLVFLRN